MGEMRETDGVVAAMADVAVQEPTAWSERASGTRGGNGSDTARVAELPASAEAAAAAPQPDLDSSDLYLNRELTWLEFNRRVLHEANDPVNPLLERIKFVAIVGSNLDEFFMKRIGGLKQQVGAGIQQLTVDGRTPQQQINECHALVRAIEDEQRILLADLLQLLNQHGIEIATYDALATTEQEALRDYYFKNIFPLVTPQAMDPAHPFPFVSNLSLNLLITVRYPGDTEPSMARVKVPVGTGIPRFLRVGDAWRFVRLEDVMAHNLDLLVPDMEIDSCELFRVTRNANTERDEDEADDLVALIESELRDRKFAPIVRLEVARGMDPHRRGMLASELGLNERDDVFEPDGMMGIRDLMEIASLDVAALHDPPHRPTDHPKLQETRSIFHIIRDSGSLLVHHPYESFTTSVERFLREASEDPKVRAIKMTLYRTSPDSNVLNYLIDASRNGKQVAVVVELKARFQEAANLQFANRLEEYGVHVTYGVVGLKTHCKVILVVRQDYNGLRRYAHIGTGNYHAGTARIYADFGVLTCDGTIGQDLTELFNYLTTGYRPKRKYRKLLVAPTMLKKVLIAKIEREMAAHTPEAPGLLQFKMNALEDADIIKALYRASQAGVKVELIVRDTCRLRPGLAGISDNVRVISIVGRFLEHGRIYYFRNAGEEEYYIGSADCMKRNLESRVEVVVPVEDPQLRAELRSVLDAQLGDTYSAWTMQPDGNYLQAVVEPDARGRSSQNTLIELAQKRQKQAGRLRKRRPKGFGRRAAP
jgi:polyphosphate kinase